MERCINWKYLTFRTNTSIPLQWKQSAGSTTLCTAAGTLSTAPVVAQTEPLRRLAFEFVVLYCTVVETLGKNGPLPLEVTNFLFDGQAMVDEIELRAAEGIADGAKIQETQHVEWVDVKPDEPQADVQVLA